MTATVQRERYSETQVFCGLQDVWQDMTGSDETFELDTQIVAFMKADGSWDEIDFADVFRRLESFFDFSCSRTEWLAFFAFDDAKRDVSEWEQVVAPRLTFRALVQFIADRAPVIASFDPINVCGRKCSTAGVFTGIQQLVGQRVAPSDQIIDVLRGQALDRFWRQLRWLTENSIPALPSIWCGVTAMTGCQSFLVVAVGTVVALAASDSRWCVSAMVWGLVVYLIALCCKWAINPLPPEIITFRDLSTTIARARNK